MSGLNSSCKDSCYFFVGILVFGEFYSVEVVRSACRPRAPADEAMVNSLASCVED